MRHGDTAARRRHAAACASLPSRPPAAACTYQARPLVEASRKQHRRLCRVPRQRLHLVVVVRQGVLAGLGGHVPHLDRLVRCRAISCKGDASAKQT